MSIRSLLTRFLPTTSPVTANVAKERLQLMISQQRGSFNKENIDLKKMQSQILQVVGQYWNVDAGDVSWSVRPSEDNNNMEILELQVPLPRKS
eukprot:TRINITY_DN7639_c0_g1_i1.p1 TRINITY_DN7639_c0_g1~~TRINITY_DN7639_c0_g1_i1.p1  ORF type:complete len:101 (-),score=18.23 TRINITY_DN7639_c0_g1_i1:34-312(-)